MRTLLKIGILGLSLAAIACGSDDPPTIAVSASPTTFAPGGSTTLTVTVTNFELREPPGTHSHSLTAAQHDHEHGDSHDDGETLSADGGHYHVYLDSTDTNPILMAWDASTAVTVTATEAGSHRLIVRLNADDHRFLKPEVKAHVDITLE